MKRFLAVFTLSIIYCGTGAILLTIVSWVVCNANSWISVLEFVKAEAGFHVPTDLWIGIWFMAILAMIILCIFAYGGNVKKESDVSDVSSHEAHEDEAINHVYRDGLRSPYDCEQDN